MGAVAEAVGVVSFLAHPYADKFPMLGEGELSDLAESIRANGLRNPVVITVDGLILDGRNRAAACERIGIEPETVTYEGDDLAEYVIDCNVTRRNMTTGARAMATALVLAADGRRENGRWRRGSVDNGPGSDSAWAKAVQRAGVILDYAPDAADDVIGERVELRVAFDRADAIRRSAEADKVRERELRKRERDEAKEEAERNARIVADLTAADQDGYLTLINAGQMSPPAAWAAYQEDTRKERRREEELDRGRRDTCTRIAECVRYLDGGPDAGDIFLSEFYPHEQRFLAEGMWLTRERVSAAIGFLTTIEKGLRQ